MASRRRLARRYRFLHEHERDPVEAESVVRFALELACEGLPPIGFRLWTPSSHDYPAGYAHWGSRQPAWLNSCYTSRSPRPSGARAISICVVSDASPVLGQPHVCWHASGPKRALRARREAGEHVEEYQPEAVAALAAGEAYVGRWPIVTLDDWREALVHTAAHEIHHLALYWRGAKQSEVACERRAAFVLREWRAR